MNARDAILAALGAQVQTDHAIAAEARALIGTTERPAVTGDIVAAFLQALAQPSVAATTDRIEDTRAFAGTVARYLDDVGLPHALTLTDPSLAAATDWSRFTLAERPPVDGGVVVAKAHAAVAETGSLVLETGPGLPMLPHFLALHHIILVPADAIVAQLEDIPQHLPAPRAHFWITGVSGTTDIEGQYVRGAHGPRFLHVIVAG